MKQYHELLQKVLDDGIESEDRTNVGTISIFGESFKIDLTKGFPLLTTKYVSFKNILVELVWFLKGETNAQYMLDNNCHIWDEWLDENTNLPNTYPQQWRNFKSPNDEYGIDQIKNVIKSLKEDPYSRRHIVVAYNPMDAHLSALPACHSFFQFYVRNNKLSCLFYMRSNDLFLGNPYNIASYALLTHIIAKLTGYDVHELIYMGGDVHIYKNHIEQVKEQLSRDYDKYPIPFLEISDDLVDIDDVKLEYFTLKDYQSYPSIKADVAV
jgi:thymidylate synthase